VDGSEVLCGAGPNGGHTGVPLKTIATANVARLIEFSHSPKSLCHKYDAHLPSLFLLTPTGIYCRGRSL
jgi:hypothetical protein